MKHFAWKEVAGKSPCRAGISHLGASQVFPFHSHDFPEVFWISQGTGTHSINGEQRKLTPGILVMIRASDRHGFASDAGGMVIQNVAIRPSLVAAIQREHFRSDDIFWSGSVAAVPRHHELGADQLRLMNRAFAEVSEGDFGEFNTLRFLLNLLHSIHVKPRLVRKNHRLKYPNLPDWLAEALTEWSETPDSFRAGTPALSRLSSRSPEHVARVLRDCTGLTPTDWLNEARMRHAAKQLEITNRKVLDIALECGFDSLGHFYSVFNKAHGCAPRHYRQRFQPRPI